MRRLIAPTLDNNLWKMHAIRLLFWMHFFAAVLVPFFRDWGGITFTQIFVLNAWFMLWNFLLEVPTGAVADLFGRRISLALGALVTLVAALVYTSTPRFPVFLCAEVLFAISFTLMSGADEALVYDTLVHLRRADTSKRVFARLESFKLAGIIVGALSGSFIAKQFGLRAPLMLQTVPAAVCCLIALTLVEPGVPASGHGSSSFVHTLLAGVRYFRSHRILRVLALDMVGSASLAWLIIWTYQPELERIGVDLVFFGAVHALMCVGQILLLSNIGRVEALVGSKTRYLLLSAVLPGAAFIVIGVSHHVVPMLVAILVAAGFGLSRPALFVSYMNKHIPPEQRATVLSTISMLRTLAIAVINPVAGALADWSLSWTMVIVGVAAIALAFFTRVEEAHLLD